MAEPAATSSEHQGPDTGLAAVLLRPLQGTNAFEATVEQLATAIRLGVFADGDRLPPERELAASLGVSRATLREAIAALRQAGLSSPGPAAAAVPRSAPTTPSVAEPGPRTPSRANIRSRPISTATATPWSPAGSSSRVPPTPPPAAI